MTGTTRPASHPATPWSNSESDKRIQALPGFGWAWEFARRNRSFQQSWRDSVAHFESAAIGPRRV